MMKIRIASTLLALALPLVAQASDASPAAVQGKAPQVDATFYKAYYLEKGKRDFDGAMALYASFLAKAPTHKLAGEAANLQFRLLDRTGKSKERDAFKAKYAKLLGNVGTTATRPARGQGDAGARPERGGRGQGGDRPERGQRGQRGGRRGGGSIFGLLRDETKVADMTAEQLEALKTGVEGASSMIDRMRGRMGDEIADKLTKSTADLKKALEGDDKAAVQKALDGLKESMGGMLGGRRGGRGGEQGGGRGGRGGEQGGGRGGRGGEQGGGRGGRGGNREGGGGGGTGAGGGGGGGR